MKKSPSAKESKTTKAPKVKAAKIKTPKAPEIEVPKTLTPAEIKLNEQRTKQLVTLVQELAGENGAKIVKSIGDEAVTDDKIEKGSGLKIAEIRSVLNHLHSYGLVEYSKEKNMQTGWFTYTWKINSNRALSNFLAMKQNEYRQLKSKLQTQDGAQIYACGAGCVKIPFDEAFETQFKCPACAKKLNFVDFQEELTHLETKINALNQLCQQQKTQ